MLELRETFLMPPIDTEALALSELSADLNPQPVTPAISQAMIV